MKRLNSEVVASLFWIAVGVFFAWGAVKMNIGTLVRGMIRPSLPLSRIPWKPHVLIVASVFFYGYLVNIIGFLPSTFILMSILFGLSITGERKWARILLCSAVTALTAWLTFSVVLNVPFPSPLSMTIWR
jgi:hypothetical protein